MLFESCLRQTFKMDGFQAALECTLVSGGEGPIDCQEEAVRVIGRHHSWHSPIRHLPYFQEEEEDIPRCSGVPRSTQNEHV